MSKIFAIAFAAATLVGTGASFAQSIDIGPGGPRIDMRSERQRERDREIRREERYRDRGYEVRRYRGEGRCREVTIRERDEDGDVVVRRRRECR